MTDSIADAHRIRGWGTAAQSRSLRLRKETGHGMGLGLSTYCDVPPPKRATPLDPAKRFHQLWTKDSNIYAYETILLQTTTCNKRNILMINSYIIMLKTFMVFSHYHLITEWIYISIIISNTEKADVRRKMWYKYLICVLSIKTKILNIHGKAFVDTGL